MIYDAAHAFGVKTRGESVLSHGDLSVLSFHATKVFNTFEGGAIVCPDAKTKQRIDYLKNFGFVDEVTVVDLGVSDVSRPALRACDQPAGCGGCRPTRAVLADLSRTHGLGHGAHRRSCCETSVTPAAMYDAAIFLREIEQGDLSAINAWRADRTVVNALVGAFRHVNGEVDRRWYEGYMANRANNVRLAICQREDNECIGVVYLLKIDWVNRSSEFGIQIGHEKARGQGIGEAATRLALSHAFDDLNLHRVCLSVRACRQ